jgi:hypothetical protein
MKKAALKCVGYFNGTPVYSDKILVGDIVCTPRGARLTFKGGSTCDTGTGSITIKGSATIRIGDDKGQREEQPSEAQEQLPTPCGLRSSSVFACAANEQPQPGPAHRFDQPEEGEAP